MGSFRNSWLYRARSRLIRELCRGRAFRGLRRGLLGRRPVCRLCGAGDLPLLAELYREMRPSAPADEAAEAAEREYRAFSGSDGLFLVAVGKYALLGYATSCLRAGASGEEPAWTLEGLYVARVARAAGLGEALVRACEREARARGGIRLRAYVFARNSPAAGLFVKLGYRSHVGEGQSEGYLVFERDLDAAHPTPDRAVSPQ